MAGDIGVGFDLAILHQRPVGVLIAVNHRADQVGSPPEDEQVTETRQPSEDRVRAEPYNGEGTRF